MRWQLASTFAVTAMSAGCYGPTTVDCGNDVLCPAGEVCTGNKTGNLCGLPEEIVQCESGERILCEQSNRNHAGGEQGLCIDKLCAPCAPELFECRYDAWTSVGISPAGQLNSIWVEAPNKAFAVGRFGKRAAYDGETWTSLEDTPGAAELYGVWSTGGDTFSVSSADAGYIYRGTSLFESAGFSLRGIWGTSLSDIVVVGAGQNYGEFNGSSWSWSQAGDPFAEYTDVFGVGGAVIVVGSAGHVLRRVSGVWAALAAPLPEADDLLGVWASSPDDIFVVGAKFNDTAHGVIHHFSGGTWTTEAPLDVPPKLTAIWGASENELYAVGEQGVVLSRSSGSWIPIPLPTQRLNDISGSGHDAIAVGDNGSLWRISPP